MPARESAGSGCQGHRLPRFRDPAAAGILCHVLARVCVFCSGGRANLPL